MSVKTIVTATTAVFLAVSAQAATVYDESVLGDALPGGRQGTTTMIETVDNTASVGSLSLGSTNTLMGSVSGIDDHVDAFAFTTTGDFSISIDAYESGDGNMTSGFWLTPGDSPMLFDIDRTVGRSFSGPAANIFGTVDPGSYIFWIYENGSASPATYTASINVAGNPGPVPSVPLPASVMLLGGALALLGRASVRRR